jgi:hypothetical protein
VTSWLNGLLKNLLHVSNAQHHLQRGQAKAGSSKSIAHVNAKCNRGEFIPTERQRKGLVKQRQGVALAFLLALRSLPGLPGKGRKLNITMRNAAASNATGRWSLIGLGIAVPRQYALPAPSRTQQRRGALAIQ